ncbi:hypothetical protein RJT34_07849 [Clitoria ternatea]|uniref:Uncharacterized protein n=1 Tax=Clitoria ternatea TaxID=43366 RepID=A0AAN9K703_CLITE
MSTPGICNDEMFPYPKDGSGPFKVMVDGQVVDPPFSDDKETPAQPQEEDVVVEPDASAIVADVAPEA